MEKVVFREDDKQWRVAGYFVYKSFSIGGGNQESALTFLSAGYISLRYNQTK